MLHKRNLILKRCFAVVAFLGFVFAYGTIGTSDLEMEIHKQLITDQQLYTRLLISFTMMILGTIGYKHNYKCNNNRKEGKNYGTIYTSKNSNYDTVGH